MTNLSIPDELVQKAKEAQINMSAVAERAIKERLNIKEVQVKDICEFCGKAGPKESLATIQERNPRALTYLNPDFKWICNICLNTLISKHVSVTKA